VARRLAIGAAFLAVLVLLGAVVTLPVWVHPVNEDEARALALRQPGFPGYHVSDVRLEITVDGRVRDTNGFVVYTLPGPRLELAGASAAPPAAFWLVHLESAAHPCSIGLVVIDARSHQVVSRAGGGRRCSQF
jgi:hypothetical protein